MGLRPFWKGRRVLLTGHTGFKGAWLALWLEQLGAEVTGFALDPETPGCAFTAFSPWPRLDSRIGDVRDLDAVLRAVSASRPEVVFHLAAQALVGRGWAEPVLTYETNVVGTCVVLEALSQARLNTAAVVVVTSDKVYFNDEAGLAFDENSPLGGADPYSASKAAAEHVVTAWRRGNANARVATARAGNVIGGGDVTAGRLLPDAWSAVRHGQPLELRHHDGVRPWQFVLEPLAGYLLLAEKLASGVTVPGAVNFGPEASDARPVREVADLVFAGWGSGGWVRAKGKMPPESQTLRLDASLARRALGWTPRLALNESIEWTVDWWKAAAQSSDMRALGLGQVGRYEALAN